MSGFSTEWLALREPFDHEARSTAWPALKLFQAYVARHQSTHATTRAFSVVDLACGTGANLRALAPRIRGLQRWRLIDHDPALLAALPGAMAHWAQEHAYRIDAPHGSDGPLHITAPDFRVELLRENTDLAHGLASLDLAQADLLTASALLDLVSAPWLEALLRQACAHHAAVLFALSVDGRTAWEPADGADLLVHRLFGEHQRRDKGFGPALGPAAVPHACDILAAAGYTTERARSDWTIAGAHAPDMLAAMVQGMANAAIEQQPDARAAVQDWQARRLACAAITRLRVGHEELVGLPP